MLKRGLSETLEPSPDPGLQERLAKLSADLGLTEHSGGSAQATQPKTGGGLFGSTTGTSAQAAPSLFGTSTAASNANAPSSLFGGSTAVGTQAGSLASPRSTPQAQPFGGSLTGNAATTTGQTGSLFGTTNAQQPQQQQQSGGLFGSTAQPQQQQTGGLFGSTAQPQQSGGLFAGLGQSQPQQQSRSLFGASQAQTQPQQGGGMFSLSAAKPAGGVSSFGGSVAQPSLPPLGLGQNVQAQQTVPGVRIDLSNVKGVTRFSDLHEDIQKEIILIEDFIQRQISYKEQIDAIIPKTTEQMELIAPDVNYLTGRGDTIELALENDVQAVKALRDMVKQDVDDAKLSFRSIENLKLPPQFHYQSTWQPASSAAAAAALGDDEAGPVDLVSYFTAKANDLDAQLKTYMTQVAEIEAHLRTVESSAGAQAESLMLRARGAQNGESGAQSKVRELARTMKLFEDAIVNVASRVGEAREEVVDLSVGGQGNGHAGTNGNVSAGSPWRRGMVAPMTSPERRPGWS